MDMSKLNPMQCLFVFEYVKDFNASAAARRAGYSERSAGAQGCELLKHPIIQACIAEAIGVRAEQVGIDAQWVLDELTKLYNSSIGDFVSISETTGEPYYDFRKVTEEQLKYVDSLEIAPGKFGTKIKVSLGSKQKTLDMIGKHTDVEAFKDKVEHTGAVQVVFDEQDKDA